jgi:PPOX class probable F420-dependent enzyme
MSSRANVVGTTMEATNLADSYRLPPIDWAHIEDGLRGELTQAPETGGPNRHTYWLTTINADGSPHVTGVGALWADGCFWFQSGQGTRKGRNLARDPRCAMSIATHDFDLTVEGEATLVTDPATIADMAARWAAGGWPARVDDTGLALTAEYNAPSAGPPPWYVYRLTPRTATALATIGAGGATRWRF